MDKLDKIIPHMRTLGRAMSKYAQVERKPFDFGVGMDLYPAEIHMVDTVVRLEEADCKAGVVQLAAEAGVTKGAVSQLVTKLTCKGLLLKEPDPENGSKVIIRTTEMGRKANSNHHRFHMEHDKEFLEYLYSLDAERLEMLKELSVQMEKWMDNYLD